MLVDGVTLTTSATVSLAGAPAQPKDATSKEYVDSALNTIEHEVEGVQQDLQRVQQAVNTIPYDVGFAILGRPNPNDSVARFIAVRAFAIPQHAVGSLAKASIVSTSSVVLSLRKNGQEFGTVSFAAGVADGVISLPAQVSFAAGDIFTAETSDSYDDTFANAQITLAGSLM